MATNAQALSATSPFKRADFLEITVDLVDVPQLIDFIIFAAASNQKALVNNVNVHAYYLARKNARFKEVLNRSTVVFCDGFGVKWGARLHGITLGERMTPPDWIDALLDRCAKERLGVYFLGDEPEVVALFARQVSARHPNLQVCGFHHGFFHGVDGGKDQVIHSINQSGAKVLVTGMGMPLQEIWAFENQDSITTPVILGTGALFRWYTGFEQRGPKIMTDNGLEWLWRLFVQPKKVWRRYIVELPIFGWWVAQSKIKGKESKKPR